MSKSIGLVGARGYVGAEMLTLLGQHPEFECAFACSSSQAGDLVQQHVPAAPDGLVFENLTPEEAAARKVDALVLCLPDGHAAKWCPAFEGTGTVILDVSSDHRFTDDWTYGLTEHFRADITRSTRISNPGCYATAGQLALRPMVDDLAEAPHGFGVSGYSGAGRTPSPRNDPEALADGVTPYKLVHHTHEREMSRHLGTSVRFSPHVAPFFRGITFTVQAKLQHETSEAELLERAQAQYASDPLVHVTEEMPRVQTMVDHDGAIVGGFSVNPERPNEVAVVCVIDNLRKGAAGQALQNLNLALGCDEALGLDPIWQESTA